MSRSLKFVWLLYIYDRASGLSPRARLVASAYANYMKTDGDDAFPTLVTLAGDTGLNKSQVVEARRELVGAGWMVYVSGGGRGRRSTYAPAIPADYEPSESWKKGPAAGPFSDEKGPETAQKRSRNGAETVPPRDPNKGLNKGLNKRARGELSKEEPNPASNDETIRASLRREGLSEHAINVAFARDKEAPARKNRRGYLAAIARAEQDVLDAAEDRRRENEAAARARAECDLCDEAGFIEVERYGEVGFMECDHASPNDALVEGWS